MTINGLQSTAQLQIQLTQKLGELDSVDKEEIQSKFQKNAPHPTQSPWDYVFSQRKSYWVIVTLKDGVQIAGLYSSNSFASSAPSPEQIYLEQSWKLNDSEGFEREHNQTDGVIIISSEISHIELFKHV